MATSRPTGGFLARRLNGTTANSHVTNTVNTSMLGTASNSNDVRPDSSTSDVVQRKPAENIHHRYKSDLSRPTTNEQSVDRPNQANFQGNARGSWRNRGYSRQSESVDQLNSATTAEKPNSNRPRSHVQINYSMLTKLAEKAPDEILGELLNQNFPFTDLLNHNRMKDAFDWIFHMTKILERVTTCEGAEQRISMVLRKIPDTKYVDGIHDKVRERDPITDELPYKLIQPFLKMFNRFLAIVPSSSEGLLKVSERIELNFRKKKFESPEYAETEAILDEVVERLQEIERRNQRNKQQQQAQGNNQANTHRGEQNHGPPPDNYREVSIIPDIQEILSEKRCYLRANIVNGVYENAEHYLDVHFRLLREDFVRPLRERIQQYRSGQPGSNFNVRIYENVFLLGSRLSPKSGIVFDLVLDRTKASNITWTNSRRLLYGNLLLLTFDNFENCLFVTVEDRSNVQKNYTISVQPLDKLNHAHDLQISLEDIPLTTPLIMIETMTYFEAYRPVLNALQIIPTDDTFPLQQYLLRLKNATDPPGYVNEYTTYDFTPLLVDPTSNVKAVTTLVEVDRGRGVIKKTEPVPVRKQFHIEYEQGKDVPTEYKKVPLLRDDQWPSSDELHLNPKQREALILALTHKVALIQGPPGTGKTFLGVRIAETLLHNRSVWCPQWEQSTPILMICNTNHALDQYLELIKNRLKLTEGIIRVGNRCQNPAIKPFALTNARRYARDNRSIPREIYHQKHVILDRKRQAEENLKFHNENYHACSVHIIPYWQLSTAAIIDDHHLSSLKAYDPSIPDESLLFNWLGLGYVHVADRDDILSSMDAVSTQTEQNVVENEEVVPSNENNVEEGESNEEDKIVENGTNQNDLNEEEEEELRRRNEIDFDDNFIPSLVFKPERQTTHQYLLEMGEYIDDDGEGAWQTVGKSPKQVQRLIKYIIEKPTTLTDETVYDVQEDLWKLSLAERFDLYRYWLLKYRMYCHNATKNARFEYYQAMATLAEYYQEEDYYLLKDSLIVAMTTTGAARYHTVLEKLQSKIVIVEEAAAIFEAHIITALSTKCEHLILIGDHVQLRPNPSVYTLARDFKLEVSLFERLINNRFPNVRLNIQHRMRPEIARLMKNFYDDLEDHESVKADRKDIRAIHSNIYFIDHTNREMAVADGSSKKNEFEADYVIQLAAYLIKQGYRTDQITILVMYLGQRQYIARKTKQMKLLEGLRITVTDNYQGEENDIILLSLVRSNADNSIGFLAIANRVCVALSRARHGLFIIGNMRMLAEENDLWKKIRKTLADQNSIGSGLILSCLQHSKERFTADKPESFANRPEGGCNKQCIARLECGHQCDLMCHNYDPEHKEVVCYKKCPTILSCGHNCSTRCHLKKPDQHDPCRIRVDKIIDACRHPIQFPCSQTPKIYDCKVEILKVLSCDHANQVPCGIASVPSELRRFLCLRPCDKSLACEHKCSGTCGKCRSGQLHIPCQSKCERPLVCGHVCRSPCAVNCPPCTQNCQTRCVHSECRKQCGELCVPCKEPCAYKCKHLKCTRLCSEPCNRGPCNESCDKTLDCGHPCIGMCGEPCPTQCRICNHQVVREIFFGDEDEPDARFVHLPDCEHLIEVKALDRFIFGTDGESKEQGAIRFPECPKCKKPMRRCTRYMPIMNRIQNRIEKVKQKILGYQSVDEIQQKQSALLSKYQNIAAKLVELDTISLKRYFSVLEIPNPFLSNESFVLMENILLFITEIEKILINGKKRLHPQVFGEEVFEPLTYLKNYLFMQNIRRNFATQQLEDIQSELERVQCVISFEILQEALTKANSSSKLNADEQGAYDLIKCLAKKKGQFTNADKQKFDELLKKLEKKLNLPGLGITEKERIAIVKALNLSAGHWYICPNEHPYIITECGGANQISRCPECGERIGGENHGLLSTNRHFGRMDGSQHAAWSNEANMNLPP